MVFLFMASLNPAMEWYILCIRFLAEVHTDLLALNMKQQFISYQWLLIINMIYSCLYDSK